MDQFFAIWSNGRKDEDAPGQRVLVASSKDFIHWTDPRPLVDSVTDSNGVERVLTAAGFHQHGGVLVAYFGNYLIVSRQKEAVEVRRVGLNQLDAVSGAPIPVPSPEEKATVEPKLRAGVLLNPGKGWSAGGLPDRHPKEVLDLLGMGVMRLDWASVEPQEGQYHWTALDRFLDSWGRLGKVCNVGVMCANTHGRDPDGYVTPRWVFEAGAPGRGRPGENVS